MPGMLCGLEPGEQHQGIITAGLPVYERQADIASLAESLFQADITDSISLIECLALALALAKQEMCTLLNGDAKPR